MLAYAHLNILGFLNVLIEFLLVLLLSPLEFLHLLFECCVSPLLVFSHPLFNSGGLSALFHGLDVFEVVLLNLLELGDGIGVIEVYFVSCRHFFKFLSWLREVQVHYKS